MLLPMTTAEARTFFIDQAVGARLSVRALRALIGRQGFERNEIANAQAADGAAVPLDSFRDLYFLNFLGLEDAYSDRDLEEAIIQDMEEFLLDVSSGWGFLARLKRMTVGNDDFYLDLLFRRRNSLNHGSRNCRLAQARVARRQLPRIGGGRP